MAIERHVLSKSTFMYGCQCTKRLWLHKFRPALRNPIDDQQQAIFAAGTNVGQLAQQLFPGGIDASPEDTFSYQLSVERTSKLIKSGVSIIYEAAFQFQGVLCALDILVKRGNKWYAYEVKGSTGIKEPYINDAALQYYVITNSGLDLEDISIVYLNNEYVRKGKIDVHKLFITESILNDIAEKQPEIASKIEELKVMISRKEEEPVTDIGPHCSTPYGCDFTNYCWKDFPTENNIFSLAYGPGWKLYEDGYKHLDDIPDDYPMQNRPALQLKHHRSRETYIDREAIQAFVDELEYPLYFFDFETSMYAIPEFNQSRTYQQIPFQFSLYVQKSPDGGTEHFEFLGDGETDPREQLILEMIKHLGKKGNIIGWNIAFEKTRITELANDFPAYKRQLLQFNERMVDLIVPFRKRWYYHPDFRGSASIKNVLPVLVPELSYSNLDIQEGGTASMTYAQLKDQDTKTRIEQRKQLMEYCKLDTWAMVKILKKLKEI